MWYQWYSFLWGSTPIFPLTCVRQGEELFDRRTHSTSPWFRLIVTVDHTFYRQTRPSVIWILFKYIVSRQSGDAKNSPCTRQSTETISAVMCLHFSVVQLCRSANHEPIIFRKVFFSQRWAVPYICRRNSSGCCTYLFLILPIFPVWSIFLAETSQERVFKGSLTWVFVEV